MACLKPALASLLVLLILTLDLKTLTASRPAKHLLPPPALIRARRKNPKPPATGGLFHVNRHKMIETDAFRPTSGEGRSPGAGHGATPSYKP